VILTVFLSSTNDDGSSLRIELTATLDGILGMLETPSKMVTISKVLTDESSTLDGIAKTLETIDGIAITLETANVDGISSKIVTISTVLISTGTTEETAIVET